MMDRASGTGGGDDSSILIPLHEARRDRQDLPVARLYTNRLFAANVALYLRSGYAIDREVPFWGGVKVHMSKRVLPASPDPPTAPPAPA